MVANEGFRGQIEARRGDAQHGTHKTLRWNSEIGGNEDAENLSQSIFEMLHRSAGVGPRSGAHFLGTLPPIC